MSKRKASLSKGLSVVKDEVIQSSGLGAPPGSGQPQPVNGPPPQQRGGASDYRTQPQYWAQGGGPPPPGQPPYQQPPMGHHMAPPPPSGQRRYSETPSAHMQRAPPPHPLSSGSEYYPRPEYGGPGDQVQIVYSGAPGQHQAPGGAPPPGAYYQGQQYGPPQGYQGVPPQQQQRLAAIQPHPGAGGQPGQPMGQMAQMGPPQNQPGGQQMQPGGSQKPGSYQPGMTGQPQPGGAPPAGYSQMHTGPGGSQQMPPSGQQGPPGTHQQMYAPGGKPYAPPPHSHGGQSQQPQASPAPTSQPMGMQGQSAPPTSTAPPGYGPPPGATQQRMGPPPTGMMQGQGGMMGGQPMYSGQMQPGMTSNRPMYVGGPGPQQGGPTSGQPYYYAQAQPGQQQPHPGGPGYYVPAPPPSSTQQGMPGDQSKGYGPGGEQVAMYNPSHQEPPRGQAPQQQQQQQNGPPQQQQQQPGGPGGQQGGPGRQGPRLAAPNSQSQLGPLASNGLNPAQLSHALHGGIHVYTPFVPKSQASQQQSTTSLTPSGPPGMHPQQGPGGTHPMSQQPPQGSLGPYGQSQIPPGQYGQQMPQPAPFYGSTSAQGMQSMQQPPHPLSMSQPGGPTDSMGRPLSVSSGMTMNPPAGYGPQYSQHTSGYRYAPYPPQSQQPQPYAPYRPPDGKPGDMPPPPPGQGQDVGPPGSDPRMGPPPGGYQPSHPMYPPHQGPIYGGPPPGSGDGPAPGGMPQPGPGGAAPDQSGDSCKPAILRPKQSHARPPMTRPGAPVQNGKAGGLMMGEHTKEGLGSFASQENYPMKEEGDGSSAAPQPPASVKSEAPSRSRKKKAVPPATRMNLFMEQIRCLPSLFPSTDKLRAEGKAVFPDAGLFFEHMVVGQMKGDVSEDMDTKGKSEVQANGESKDLSSAGVIKGEEEKVEGVEKRKRKRQRTEGKKEKVKAEPVEADGGDGDDDIALRNLPYDPPSSPRPNRKRPNSSRSKSPKPTKSPRAGSGEITTTSRDKDRTPSSPASGTHPPSRGETGGRGARSGTGTPTPAQKSPKLSRSRSPKPPMLRLSAAAVREREKEGAGAKRKKGRPPNPVGVPHTVPLAKADAVVGLKVDAKDPQENIYHAARIRRLEKLSLNGLDMGRRASLTNKSKDVQSLWVQVHFEGWGSEYDEWLQIKSLRHRTDDCWVGPLGLESEEKWDRIRNLYEEESKQPHHTGVVYDAATLIHRCTCEHQDLNHPEKPQRIVGILQLMDDSKLLDRVVAVRGREVTRKELTAVHDEAHVVMYGGKELGATEPPACLETMPCGGTGVAYDTICNEDSPVSARVSSGCLVALTYAVVKGNLSNGFAIIRPPGHHAEHNQAGGFCFFNNVGVAVRAAQDLMGIKRVLIVDWDVHHGNGTQDIFFNDPTVLYMSIHRHDDGQFYPYTGKATEVGEGPGEGFTVNIPWRESVDKPPGNTEYIAAFHHFILPIAREFDPELVFVSAGFDAADGDELGGCKVTPEGFAHMTQQLLELANGKVILSLEGGYHISSLSASAVACLRVLLGEPAPALSHTSASCFSLSLNHRPHHPQPNAVSVFQEVAKIQSKHWKCMDALNARAEGLVDGDEDGADLSDDDALPLPLSAAQRSRSPTPAPRGNAGSKKPARTPTPTRRLEGENGTAPSSRPPSRQGPESKDKMPPPESESVPTVTKIDSTEGTDAGSEQDLQSESTLIEPGQTGGTGQPGAEAEHVSAPPASAFTPVEPPKLVMAGGIPPTEGPHITHPIPAPVPMPPSLPADATEQVETAEIGEATTVKTDESEQKAVENGAVTTHDAGGVGFVTLSACEETTTAEKQDAVPQNDSNHGLVALSNEGDVAGGVKEEPAPTNESPSIKSEHVGDVPVISASEPVAMETDESATVAVESVATEETNGSVEIKMEIGDDASAPPITTVYVADIKPETMELQLQLQLQSQSATEETKLAVGENVLQNHHFSDLHPPPAHHPNGETAMLAHMNHPENVSEGDLTPAPLSRTESNVPPTVEISVSEDNSTAGTPVPGGARRRRDREPQGPKPFDFSIPLRLFEGGRSSRRTSGRNVTSSPSRRGNN